VPIPAAPDGGRAHPLAAADALFRQLHEEVRSAISGVSDSLLHWRPADGANSMATLVVHLLASEAETMNAIAGIAVDRDRESEFVESALSGTDLAAMLDHADQLLVQVAIKAPDLGREVTLPTLPADEKRPAMTWLIANYGHAREHLGQLLLTKQLALESRAD
jgi:hypothetical protein